MLLSYFNFSIPVIGLLVNAIVQVVLFRFRNITKLGLLKSICAGFAVGFASVMMLEYSVFAAHILSAKEFAGILIANVIIYCTLIFCYVNFINMGETARRIRILRELCDSKEGLSMEEIFKRYNADEIIERRLGRLIDNGQIIERAGRFYIGSPVMFFIAKIVVTMKMFLLRKKSEFE